MDGSTDATAFGEVLALCLCLGALATAMIVATLMRVRTRVRGGFRYMLVERNRRLHTAFLLLASVGTIGLAMRSIHYAQRHMDASSGLMLGVTAILGFGLIALGHDAWRTRAARR